MLQRKLVRIVCLTLIFVLLGAQSAFANGVIQGTITRGDGGPMNGGHAAIYSMAGNLVTIVSSSSEGTWSVSLPSNDYFVLLQAGAPYANGWWRASTLTPLWVSAQQVCLLEGATQTCNGTLPVAGTIAGTVTSAISHTNTNASINAYWYDDVSGQWVSLNTQSVLGPYTVSGLFPGTYKLSASQPGFITDYYDGKTSLASANTTVVTSGGTVTYSPGLVPVGTSNGIHGIVHRASGVEASGTPQYFYRAPNKTYAGNVLTNADGTFDKVLTPGAYKVEIHGKNGDGSGWWTQNGLVPLFSMGETVTVSLGATESIAATVSPGASISGSIKARATGSKISTGTVTKYVLNPGTGQWESDWGQSVYGGDYTLRDLPPGTYRLEYKSDDTRLATQYWSGKSSLAVADGVTVSAGQMLTGYDVSLAANVTSETVAGLTRIDTAIDASKKMYPDPAHHAAAVIITTGWNWPDALGASALAGMTDAPILLNAPVPAAMPKALDDEVVRLKTDGATDAYILGDANAVSAGVETRLRAIFGGETKVHRLGAYGRYATSLAIAAEVERLNDPASRGTVFLAKGTDYPDALAASPLAAYNGWPVVLAESDGHGGLSARVKQFLATYATSRVIVLGSEKAIPASMADAAANAVGGAGKVERWKGDDRIGTAIDIARHSVAEPEGLSFDGMGIATAYGYADALCGGPYLAKKGNPLLLTAEALPLRPLLSGELTVLSPQVETVRFLGGKPSPLPQGVRDAIVGKLR